jgi:hypothetical protein
MSANKSAQSRSEVVRQRRSQVSAKRQKKSAQQAYSGMPPITTRGQASYAPKPKKKAKSRPSVKRRYEVAFGVGESSLSLPPISLPTRVEIGWRWLSGALSILLIWALYMLWTAPQFRVGTADVYGNQRIDPAEINNALAVSGLPVFELQPEKIITSLRLNYPEISAASVSVDMPNRVNVTITERQPLILWQQNGGYAWIDAEGIAFRPHGQVDGLINVTALGAPPSLLKTDDDPFTPAPFITADMVKALQALAPYVPAGTPISYDPQYGLGWQDQRGWQVYFGFASGEMNLKLRIYQTLVDSLTQRGVQPVMISVAYPDAPFYRLEP